MGDFVRGDSRQQKLSQPSYEAPSHPFFTKKAFSHFALFFLGMTGVFPALPQIDTKSLIMADQDVQTETVASGSYQEELCRWQRDFSFFNDLGNDDKATVGEAPCAAPALPSDQDTAPQSSGMVSRDDDLSTLIETIASGYPLEAMAKTIAEYDRSVAALLVGIAKKESDWGKHVPRSSDGADCFNYWGFKGAGSRGVAMGHGCFGSPEEAVHAVGHRIAELVALRQTSEPKNMIIWKCGSSCATHSPESVRKWISDVDLYYRKIVTN